MTGQQGDQLAARISRGAADRCADDPLAVEFARGLCRNVGLERRRQRRCLVYPPAIEYLCTVGINMLFIAFWLPRCQQKNGLPVLTASRLALAETPPRRSGRIEEWNFP